MQFLRPVRFFVVATTLALLFGSGCASTQQTAESFPDVDVLPEKPPEDLSTDAPGSILRQGSDGFLYVVGGIPDDAQPGALLVARYSGEWPLKDAKRPPLATAVLTKKFGPDTGLVHVTYSTPKSDLVGLEVSWEEAPLREPIGKGVAVVNAVKGDRVEMPVGRDYDIAEGDWFAVLDKLPSRTEAGAAKTNADLQMTQRLVGVCMVQEVTNEAATCKMWRASSEHPESGTPEEGHQLVFLEHAYGREPNKAHIQLASIQGDDDGEMRKRVRAAFKSYIGTAVQPEVELEMVEAEANARAVDFHSETKKVERKHLHQLLVGGTVADVDGTPHLFLNYSGVTGASGPGMVAAPPDRGVDMGPVADLDADRLTAFASVVYSGVLVHRGQTSEALIQLHRMLADPRLDGPLRWHARDQYAMRWGSVGNDYEALWLVLQDEAIASQNDDRRAYLNALGTRVRLYDFLGEPARAVSAARKYLDARAEEGKEGLTYLSALSMYGEMLMKDGRTDDALEAAEKLADACPDGCEGDLIGLVGGIFWSVPPDKSDAASTLVEIVMEHARSGETIVEASSRIYQGFLSMRENEPDQALIGFLEAQRLYEKAGSTSGVGRSHFFAMIAELSRGEPQRAFDRGQKALEIEEKLNDYEGMARVRGRLTALYTNPTFLEKPGMYLRSADDILGGAIEANLALGDFVTASEHMLSYGIFMLRMGQGERSIALLEQANRYAISQTHFEVAAMTHLYMALIARGEGDRDEFVTQIQRARVMGELAEDPEILEAIEDALNPEKEEPPTQLL
ncbi:MAG: tetratricopeptide repeat protein [Myxococcota bacterium]